MKREELIGNCILMFFTIGWIVVAIEGLFILHLYLNGYLT